MTMKHWIATAVDSLKASLGPIAYESNELDWKQNLSPKKDRLARHLSAFANHPNGGGYGVRPRRKNSPTSRHRAG
jgi:ATP-dependent DNA helicase RecG